jgi:hypothetical protein
MASVTADRRLSMDPRVTELHCIMPISNIESVLRLGILSNEAASKFRHHSVALAAAQEKRDSKLIPGGLKLHQYANLYFHARNPMMFMRQNEAANLCVLRVSTDVLKLEGVVLADRNAAGDPRWVRFFAVHQWRALNFDYIFARDWTDANRFVYYDKKRCKCAEVLAPHKIDPDFLTGAYVVDEPAAVRLSASGFRLPIEINPDMFFH